MGRYELEPGMGHDSPAGGRTTPALVASTVDLMQTIIATARNTAVAVKLICLRMCPPCESWKSIERICSKIGRICTIVKCCSVSVAATCFGNIAEKALTLR